MAINPYAIRAAMNEGAGFYGSTLGTTNFVGDVFSASASHISSIMSEAASISSDCLVAQELMVEAAFDGNSNLEMMDEAATGGMFTKVKEFFKKVIENIKGIISKIKAFFMQLTGKTDKWMSIMAPRVRKATSTSGASDVSYSMYEWDSSFVTKGMSEAIFKCVALSTKMTETSVSDIDIGGGERESVELTTVTNEDRFKGDTYASNVKADDLDKSIEAVNEVLDNLDDTVYEEISGTLGLGTVKSDSDISTELTKKARGDSDSKKDVKVSSKAEGWLVAIEDCTKTRENIVKVYDARLKILETERKKFEKLSTDEDKAAKAGRTAAGTNDAEIEKSNNAGELTRKRLSVVTKTITKWESVIGTAKDCNLKCLKEMTGQYMGALTSLCTKMKT